MAFTSVASGVASVTLLAANSARKSAIINNTDANTLYVLFADPINTAATTSAYTFLLAQNAQIEVPNYRGKIVGIWSGDGSGQANVTYW